MALRGIERHTLTQKAIIQCFSPIYASVRCSICGEKVIEPKARVKNGKPVCIDCAKGEYYILDGRGISLRRDHPY
ncbi:MAG: hypothetical protein DRN15_09770 [Thermoprotei archaeon]|nr:MAG: hypothetical protein DRN15_09770 [Thermoprotei archaeon]RLF24630.1 MAG: hypothetical protein DRM97_03265 [Thermoprotei archaeon]